VGLIRSYFALFENFDGALGKFQKNEQGFAYNDIFFLPTSFMAKQPPCQTKEPQRRTLRTRPLVLLPLVFTTSFAATSYRVADL